MIIYGGFVNGIRVSEIYRYFFKENKWEFVQPLSQEAPPKRAGHSAVMYGDSMVVFGGKDEENNKLNDLWEFNMSSYQWTHLSYDEPPLSRSGHSACLYKDYMMIFGGIHEVTKELDDMHIFDFKNKRWIMLFEEISSPVKRQNSLSISLMSEHL